MTPWMRLYRWIDPSKLRFFSDKDIIESVKLKKGVPKERPNAVIFDYFKLIYQNLLNGYSVDLPNNFGTMTIYKNKLASGREPRISSYETIKKRERTLSYNPHTVGYFFHIKIESEYMEKYGCKFRASPKYRKLLSQQLFKGETNFQLKQSCQE